MSAELDQIMECFSRIQRVLAEYTSDLDMEVHLTPKAYKALDHIMRKNPAFTGIKDPSGMEVLKIATGFSMIKFKPKVESFWEKEKRISLDGRAASTVIFDDPIIRQQIPNLSKTTNKPKGMNKPKEDFNFMEELSKI